jgi:hypothetical protein
VGDLFDESLKVSQLEVMLRTAEGATLAQLTAALGWQADSRIHLWTGEALARAVVKAGLFEWLVDHSQ